MSNEALLDHIRLIIESVEELRADGNYNMDYEEQTAYADIRDLMGIEKLEPEPETEDDELPNKFIFMH